MNASDQAQLTWKYVKRRLDKFQNETNEAAVRRELAILRRGAGKAPGECPEIFGILFDDFPEELLSKNGNPTQGEWAAASALCLFALPQQGMDLHEKMMNQEKCTLGGAVRKLATDDDKLESVRRRFNQLLSAPDIRSCTYYLRTLIQMLNSKEIPVDYPVLAKDLFWFQYPEGGQLVKFHWGEEFYHTQNQENSNTEEKDV